MHICVNCASDLVQPASWEPRGREWFVELHCPDCEASRSGTFTDDEVFDFDDALNRGSEAIKDELARRIAENMREYAARFTAALRADAVVPMDF